MFLYSHFKVALSFAENDIINILKSATNLQDLSVIANTPYSTMFLPEFLQHYVLMEA